MEKLCVNLTIIDDSIVESSESFVLLLNTSELQITILMESVQVLIEDDDSMFDSSITLCSRNHIFFAGVALQFTHAVYEVRESDELEQVCVEIASGYIIARSVPFTIQSVLSDQATAEGEYLTGLASLYTRPILQLEILWKC